MITQPCYWEHLSSAATSNMAGVLQQVSTCLTEISPEDRLALTCCDPVGSRSTFCSPQEAPPSSAQALVSFAGWHHLLACYWQLSLLSPCCMPPLMATDALDAFSRYLLACRDFSSRKALFRMSLGPYLNNFSPNSLHSNL